MSDSNIGNYQVECFSAIITLLWFAALAVVNSTVASDPAAVALAEPLDSRLYEFPAVAFSTSMFLSLIDTMSGNSGNRRKKLAVIPFVQNTIAVTTFLGFAYPNSFLGSPVLLDFNGRLLRPTHMLEWSFTTPAMVFLVGQTCEITPGKLATFMAATVANIMLGFMASWCHTKVLVFLCIVVSFLCFGYVQHGFCSMYKVSCEATTPSSACSSAHTATTHSLTRPAHCSDRRRLAEQH